MDDANATHYAIRDTAGDTLDVHRERETAETAAAHYRRDPGIDCHVIAIPA